MAVRRHIPDQVTVWQCSDGWFSDHNERGACHRHGGVTKEVTLFLGFDKYSGSTTLDVVDVPLSMIKSRPEWFQNRKAAFSSRSVESIVQAVAEDRFKWANLDPITLWLNQADGNLYILSGHSREEAFNRLCAAQAQADGRGFCAIPAKIFEGTYEEAKALAMESNTLATKETDLERAAYYRRLRVADGVPAGKLREMLQRTEGRNANTILAYSFLSPTGRTWLALEALDASATESKAVLTNVARWIGNAVQRYNFSTAQENELFGWMVDAKGYGTSAGQVAKETDFQNRLASIVNRRFSGGPVEPDVPLNIQNLLSKSPSEAQYDAQLEAARQNVSQLEADLKEKVISLARRGGSEAEIRRITAPQEASLTRARIEYQKLLEQKGRILEAAKNERGLFDQVAGLRHRHRHRPSYLTL